MKNFKKILGIMMVTSIAILGVGCSTDTTQDEKVQGEVIKITHGLGEVEVPKNPTSVVVTDFGILDTLDTLEIEGITGITQDTTAVPTYLQDYMSQEYTNVGGLKEPNYEVLYELKPDVIFIGGRLRDQYQELSKIAPVVYMTSNEEDYMASLEENVTRIGDIFGKETEAKELLTNIQESAKEVKETAEAGAINGLVTMINKGEVTAFGEVSRFGIIHNTLGIAGADTQLDNSTHGQVVTFEYLREVNPNYLFVVDKNVLNGDEASQTAKDTLNNPIVQTLDAAKNNRIVYLDTNAWYIATGGLRATETMIDNVRQGINK